MVKLNLARNCIKYLIQAYGIKEIFIPYYTCDTVIRTIREERVYINFYHIDKNFMPQCEFRKDDYIIYINYYGLCNENCRNLAKKYRNIIIDNTHSFYSEPCGLASFNSLRKFFPVTNGAYLYTKKLLDKDFEVDRLELDFASPVENFDKFVENEKIIDREKSIKYINPNVEQVLSDIDFASDKKVRLDIFDRYKKLLDNDNFIKLEADEKNIPYCYPFCPIDSIKYQKIFRQRRINTIRLWKDYPSVWFESLLNNTTALPVTTDSIYFLLQ